LVLTFISLERLVETPKKFNFKATTRKVLARLDCRASDGHDLEGCRPQGPQQSEVPRYQWFWAATHRETESLTPDIKHTVKRHIVVRRVVPVHAFPVERVKSAKALFRVMEVEKEETIPMSSSILDVGKEVTWKAMLEDWQKDSGRTSLECLLDFSFQVQVR